MHVSIVYWLVACVIALFVTVVLGTNEQLKIVAHHKTGTLAGYGLIVTLCCPEDEPRNVPIWELIKFRCHKYCTGVSLDEHGVAGWVLRPKVHYIHLIRHPVDVIVSGYLYHRACKEPEWTNSSARSNFDMFPENFPVKGSYCQYLQAVNASEGLFMEATRSIYAFDGLGRMLRDFRMMRNGPVLQVCLNELTNKMADEVQRFTKPWNAFNKTVKPVDYTSGHSSSSDEAIKIYHLGVEVLLKFIPAHVLISFPCNSDYFDEESEQWKTFLKYI